SYETVKPVTRPAAATVLPVSDGSLVSAAERALSTTPLSPRSSSNDIAWLPYASFGSGISASWSGETSAVATPVVAVTVTAIMASTRARRRLTAQSYDSALGPGARSVRGDRNALGALAPVGRAERRERLPIEGRAHCEMPDAVVAVAVVGRRVARPRAERDLVFQPVDRRPEHRVRALAVERLELAD